jgi:hypothetical protein
MLDLVLPSKHRTRLIDKRNRLVVVAFKLFTNRLERLLSYRQDLNVCDWRTVESASTAAVCPIWSTLNTGLYPPAAIPSNTASAFS